jgi:hypothetical protein
MPINTEIISFVILKENGKQRYNADGVQYSELLGFWTSSIVQNFKY